jgi:O-antigen ligase
MTARPVQRDAGGLLTIFLVLQFVIPAALVIRPLQASPAEVVGLLLLLWWALARLVPTLGVRRGFQPARLAIGVFGAAILASYISAALGALPGDQLRAADRGLLDVLSWAGIVVVSADMLHSVRSVERVLRRLVVLTTALACVGILQFATGVDIAGLFHFPGLTANGAIAHIGLRSTFRRVQGTASHPIEFGMVLAIVLPLALHFALTAYRRKWIWWVCVAAIGVALPMSVSRSAILGMLVAVLVLAFAWPVRLRLQAAAITPLLLSALRFVIPGLLGTLTSLFANASSDPSVQHRTEDYKLVGVFIARAPWFGRGFGTFIPQDFFFIDNQYLGQLVETGYVGLASLILVFVIGFGAARGFRRRSLDPADRHLGQALAASVLAAALGFATFDGLAFSMMDGVLFLIIGCSGACWRLTAPPVAAPRPGRALVGAHA